MVLDLLENVNVDTVGEAFDTDGGTNGLSVWADSFGGGKVTLQVSPNNGDTWIGLTEAGGNPAEYDTNVVKIIDHLSQGMKIRGVLSGSSGAANVNLRLL